MLKRFIVLTAVFSTLLIVTATASAQKPRRTGRYSSPSRPTLSPYLDYFRRDVGLTDRYNTFVNPRAQLTNRLRQQDYQLNSLGNQIKDVRSMQQVRPTGARPTGIGSSFMNYSHYYGGR